MIPKETVHETPSKLTEFLTLALRKKYLEWLKQSIN